MNADTYVQHASVENQDVVNYMQEFQGDQEKFMTALVQSLEDVTSKGNAGELASCFE